MKKIYILFFISLLFLGCEELDRQPLTTLGEATFWQSDDDAEKGVNGIYNTLAHNQMYENFFLHTDAISPNLFSVWSYKHILEISEGRGYDASSNYPKWIWGKCYEGIVRANQVLTHVPEIEMDESLKNRFMAEARFLRALFYFHLSNLYGDVPLILELQTVSDAQVPRDPKAIVVTEILKDLEFAIANLPTAHASKDLGRVTKGAAYALKSRVHLYN